MQNFLETKQGSYGESETRIGTKLRNGCRVLHLIITGSLALRHVSHPNKALSVLRHADNETKHGREKLKELTVDSSHSS